MTLDKGHSGGTEYSILQGPTTQSETVITVLYPKTSTLNYNLEVETKGGFKPHATAKIEQSLKNFEGSQYTVAKLEIKNLQTEHKYRLLFLNSQRRVVDNRTFYTLSNKQPLKVSVVSCMNDQYKEQQQAMWKSLVDSKPDVLFMIGDNVYADSMFGRLIPGGAKPKNIWKRYEQTRINLDIYRQKKLIPTYATWDDHDYGQNNGTKNFKYKEQSKEIFNSFFPQSEQTNLIKGPGVSSALSFKDVSFYFLDNRSFRDKGSANGGEHFGEEQTKWLLESVKKQSTKYIFLISGDQFFGGYHKFESFEGQHPKKLSLLLAELKKITSKRFLFVSGDRHLSEVMEIESDKLGYKTYEITSSGIHSSVYPGSFERDPNPRQIAGKDGVHNFINFNLSFERGMTLELNSFGSEQKLYFKEKINF